MVGPQSPKGHEVVGPQSPKGPKVVGPQSPKGHEVVGPQSPRGTRWLVPNPPRDTRWLVPNPPRGMRWLVPNLQGVWGGWSPISKAPEVVGRWSPLGAWGGWSLISKAPKVVGRWSPLGAWGGWSLISKAPKVVGRWSPLGAWGGWSLISKAPKVVGRWSPKRPEVVGLSGSVRSKLFPGKATAPTSKSLGTSLWVGKSLGMRMYFPAQHLKTYRFPLVACPWELVKYQGELTLSLLRVINVKILLQPHKKYDIPAVWRTWLCIACSGERWLYYTNSLYVARTIAF